MSQKFIQILSQEYNLDEVQQEILLKTTRSLSRVERRIFYQTLKPQEREIKIFLKGQYEQLNQEERQKWMDTTVTSLLDKGGEAAIIDSLLMDVMGRLEVYRTLRERSENEGRTLKTLMNFGGLSMVMVVIVVITAIILYFTH